MFDYIVSDLEIIHKLTGAERQSLINLRLIEQEELIKNINVKLKKYKILSTLQYPKVNFWNENVSTLQRPKKISDLSDYYRQLFFNKQKYDFILLSGGEKVDLIYLAFIGLFNISKIPHIVIDAHWQKSKNIKFLLQKLMLKLSTRVTAQYQPHSEEEIELYYRNFRIPINKIKPIPFSTTLIGYNIDPKKGNFILTGGGSYRDYQTFLLAINKLDYPIEIGLPNDYLMSFNTALKNFSNILIFNNLSNIEFYQKMASCKIFALPIEPRLERSTGDQSILNAMYFGKIVIATDSIGPRIYIKHGVNGFLVPESDSQAWVDTINHVYNLTEDEYSKISSRAEYTAKIIFNERIKLYKILHSLVE